MQQRSIPSTGELLPAIGLGTWQTFDSNSNDAALAEVLQSFHAGGGRLVDSSPMYGKAEDTVGRLTGAQSYKDDLFYATKVWITGRQEGIAQMERSFKRMGRETMDLVQIHNLVDWQTQLSTLRKWKEEGLVRYIGVTHYTDSYHAELERVLRQEPFDFVQFNYSIADRHAEDRLLSVAAELGVATIINRPFGEGALLRRLAGKPLPSWALESGLRNWAAFCLAFILARPEVTCVIPATSKQQHMLEILEAGDISIDAATANRMAVYIDSI
jgi:diketogulonate reductase-like aldo/keto reductase